MKQKKTMFTILIMVFILSVFPFVTVSAASKPTCKKQNYTFSRGSGYGGANPVLSFKKGDVIVSVKNSKPNALRLKASGNDLFAIGIKAGTANITMKVKRNGKTYTVKTKITVVPLNPFTSIKVGNTDLAATIKYYGGWSPSNDKVNNNKYYVSGKLTYKVRSGWSVKKIIYNDKTVKSVPNVGKDDSIEIVVKHKKSKKIATIYIDNYIWDESSTVNGI